MNRPPLKVNQQYYNLTTQGGVPPEVINFNNVGLQSERSVTVCDGKTDGSGQLITIDLKTQEVNKRVNKAEGVLPHPSRNYTAVRAKAGDNQTTVHVYNMDSKEKLLSSTVPDQIKYWTWINDKLLGLVGLRSMYHISLENLAGPNQTVIAEKVADREGPLQGVQSPVQVIGYSCCPNSKFVYAAGLCKKAEPEGGFSVGGNIQLTSLAIGKSQYLEGYQACFGKTKVTDELTDSVLFAYAEKTKTTGRVTVSEIGQPADPSRKFKVQIDMVYPDGSEHDFPVFMAIEESLGLIFLLTKLGLLFLFEISEGAMLLRSKITDSHVLAGCLMRNAKGCLALTKTGGLISIEIDDLAFVEFLKVSPHIKNNLAIARKVALKAGLPGSESFYTEQFSRLFVQGLYDDAARIAAKSPGVVLRNKETIEKFKALPKPETGPHPILKYFFVILEQGKLNEAETREICGLVLGQGKHQMIAKWVDEDKLFLTEELGDTMRKFDERIAEKIYQAINSPKVLQMRIRRGDIDSVIGTTRPDDLLSQLKTLALNDPQAALNFAKAMAKTGKLPVNSIAEVLLNASLINELTSFCLDYLPNTPDSANWQTLVLELNLKGSASVAETIFQTGKWSQYNKARIAPLCEAKGLYMRALENYTELKDLKRILLNNMAVIPLDFIRNFFTNTLPAEQVPPILTDFLKYNRNIKLAVEIAQQVFTKVGVKELVDVFEGVNAYDGIFYFLAPLLDKTKDAKIYHKFIEACVKCSQLQEIENIITKCPGLYDPEKVLQLLLSSKLADPKCLVILCDKNGYVKEMVRYLWENNFTAYIEMYVIRINRDNAGEVLGALMDLGAEENYIRQLLNTVGGNCNLEGVVREFETRNRLRLLEQWLESRVQEGCTLQDVHNSLAKLVIDFDKSPEKFLAENKFYDAKKIGGYAAGRDPHLAFIAFERDLGKCDDEILELTNKNSLYRLQAQYLIKRQSKELWAQVLAQGNPHKAAVVDQVVSFALLESKSVDEVSITVQAFMAANMPEELHGLLEKIVIHSSEFAGYKKLQNLLITTAMRTDKSRVMDYITKLDKYEGPEILKYALSPEYKLYEEALVILKKMHQPVEAINVLLEKIGSIDRAADFAEKTNMPEVWSVLAKAFLERDQLDEAAEAYMRAKDPSEFEALILLNRKVGHYDKLLEFLDMCRQQKKESSIDNEYIYCLARLGRPADLELFINGGHAADLARVGDRLYTEGMFDSARILFTKLKANSKIASCYVRVEQYQQAIEYARRANNVKTWKEIVYACVEAKEFKLAAVAGTQVVLIPDHLEDMVAFYELHEAPDEIIGILEQALTNEKSHIGIFTELAALYAKYRDARLFDFIKAYFQKLNVTKLIRVAKKQQLWREVAYLHANYKEFDLAVSVMMDHSPLCFDHDTFMANLPKVSNSDLIYKAIVFYIEEEPLRLNDLLKQLAMRVDFAKVVALVKRTGYLALIIDWLKGVQSQNNQAVNDAINQIYLEMEDYEALRASIIQYDQIDAIGLAKQIEDSNNVEFRRISALIYRKNRKYKESIELSLNDRNYRDAIETAQESKSAEICEDLLRFFSQKGNKEFFAVMNYTCYELLSPDLVMELSWRYGFQDFAMPFMVQLVRDLHGKVENVQKKQEEWEKKEEEKQEKSAMKKLDMGGLLGMGPGNALLNPGMPMLMAPTQPSSGMGGFGMQSQPTMGMGQGQQQPGFMQGISQQPGFSGMQGMQSMPPYK